jgi:hypothetical protein
LLQRTHVIVKSIKHIGKEAETIQDAEEQAILPDEIGTQQMDYQPDEKRQARKERIDRQEWETLRSRLKELARPRKVWAKKLGVTERHFKRILGQSEIVSSDLYNKILEHCKVQSIPVPKGNKPMPARFEGNPHLISNLWDIAKQSINMVEFESKFSESIFTLYGTKYVYETPEVLAYLADQNQRNRETKKNEKEKAIRELKIAGTEIYPGHSETAFEVEDIHEFQAVRNVTKNWKEIHVKLKDARICTVPRKDNELVFRLGLLPMPSKLYDEHAKEEKIERIEKNGFVTERTPFILYAQNPPISLEAVAGHYCVKTKQVKEDISRGIFPQDAVHEKNGKVFMDALAAWKFFGKGERVNG